jgi:hypothetical protein
MNSAREGRAPGGLSRCIHRVGEIVGHGTGWKLPQAGVKLRNSTVIGQARDCTGANVNFCKKSRRPSPPIDGLQTHSFGSRHALELPIFCECIQSRTISM